MPNKIVITGSEVNIRSGPGLSFNIVGKARNAEEYEWLATIPDLKDEDFVWHGSYKGWSRSDLSKVISGTMSIGSAAPGKWPKPTNGYIFDDYKPQQGHRGIDIVPYGDPGFVYGIEGARVHRVFHCVDCGSDPNKQAKVGDFSRERGFGFGANVVLYKEGFYIIYAHLQSVYVQAGDIIAKEHAIGKLGKSGNASGWHLHLEVRTNDRFDTTLNGLIDPKEKFNL